jgi:hypothetical protein
LSKPKEYSDQAKSDQNSITTLKLLLSKESVYPHLTESDKIPNYDGYIEILEDKIPIGKIEVQVKTLRKEYTIPSKSIEISVLMYIRDSALLPFVFIAVDQTLNKAFWKYIDRQHAIELINKALEKSEEQESISIQFENESDLPTKSPYEHWKELVTSQKAILHSHSQLLKKLVASTEENEKLKKLQGTDHQERDPKYLYLNRFLEQLNNLCQSEFHVLRHLFMPEFYKFGIGVFEFSDTVIEYSLFAIEWEENQKPIIYSTGLSDGEKYNYPSLRRYFKINPILEFPEKQALVHVKEYVDILLERNLLWPQIECLEREYLFFLFKQKFNHLSNGNDNSISLVDFKNEIERYFSLVPKSESERMKEFPYSHFNLYRALDYIQNYRIKGETELQNLTPTKWQMQNIAIHLTENEIFPADVEQTLETYWLNLIEAYTQFIEENFPYLKSELSFWKKCDAFIIIPSKLDNRGSQPKYLIQLNYIELLCLDGTQEKKVFVMNDDKELYFDSSLKTINFRNQNYRLTRSLKMGISHLIDELPLRQGLFRILKEKLELYFKEKFK